MVETAAHLVDHVIPRLPVGQWVLSFPWPLRMLFAARPDALARCLDVVVRSIETHLLQRAGLGRGRGARTGVVTLIQRHASAANLNVHLHMLVLDGVVEPVGEQVRFRSVAAPSEAQLQLLLTRLIARMVRRLTKDGWLSRHTEPPSLDLEPRDVVDELAAALGAPSIRHRIADGPGAGQRTLTLGSPSLARPLTPKALAGGLTADLQGFSLPLFHLGGIGRLLGRPAQQARAPCPFGRTSSHRPRAPRGRSRRSGRARAHPPLPRWHHSHGVLAGGLDGTTGRPRAQTACASHPIPLAGMGGVRAQLSTAPPCGPVTPRRCRTQAPPGQGARGRVATGANDAEPLAPMTWAEPCDGQVRRVFQIDITSCPDCGGRLRWPIAVGSRGPPSDVTEPMVVRKILLHVQSRVPPRAGPPDGNRPDSHPLPTLAR